MPSPMMIYADRSGAFTELNGLGYDFTSVSALNQLTNALGKVGLGVLLKATSLPTTNGADRVIMRFAKGGDDTAAYDFQVASYRHSLSCIFC